MDYIDINGKPTDLKKKAALHIKKLKENEKKNKIISDQIKK